MEGRAAHVGNELAARKIGVVALGRLAIDVGGGREAGAGPSAEHGNGNTHGAPFPSRGVGHVDCVGGGWQAGVADLVGGESGESRGAEEQARNWTEQRERESEREAESP